MWPIWSQGPSIASDLSREFLLTDGRGGYYLHSLCTQPTRKYHGRVFSWEPPLGRLLDWIQPLETLVVGAHRCRLYRIESSPGRLEGELGCLQRAGTEGLLPFWDYLAAGDWLGRSLAMDRSGRLVYSYQLQTDCPVRLELEALITRRDPHQVLASPPQLVSSGAGEDLTVLGVGLGLHWTLPPGVYLRPRVRPAQPQLLYLRREAERGEPSRDLVGRLDLGSAEFPAGQHRFFLTVGAAEADPALPEELVEAEVARRRSLLQRAAPLAPCRDDSWAHLVLMADNFLARRGGEQHTILAGFPWFADWGRDAMLALPGLLLETGRAALARSVLSSYATHLRNGLLPNHFLDDGSGASYHSADAALWMVQAVWACWEADRDRPWLEEMLPTLSAAMDRHAAGTDYGIAADPADGLLRAGATGWQLTWMDVKVADWVVTPRRGKPVEICGLWISALRALGRMQGVLGQPQHLAELADLAAHSFARFWNPERRYLFDVLPGSEPGVPDGRVRPNAIVALSLPGVPLDRSLRAACLYTAARELLTPLGLRTLSPLDSGYQAHYQGPRVRRDLAYHQGTVWPWLIGPLVSLALDLGEVSLARNALTGLEAHLGDAGVGGVSEVGSAADLRPDGCPFQAWSVAELLRAKNRLGRFDAARAVRLE